MLAEFVALLIARIESSKSPNDKTPIQSVQQSFNKKNARKKKKSDADPY